MRCDWVHVYDGKGEVTHTFGACVLVLGPTEGGTIRIEDAASTWVINWSRIFVLNFKRSEEPAP